MKILVINWGSVLKNIISTCILSGIKKKCPGSEVTWSVFLEEHKHIFRYNKHIYRVINQEELGYLKGDFDVVMNLDPYFDFDGFRHATFKHYMGCHFDERANEFVSVLEGKERLEHINLFQIYYILSGMTWKGEGYNIGYFPRTRSKTNRIGFAIANANLRNYVYDNMSLNDMKIWHIPYKKDIFKRMDEINRCNKVVTDDVLTFHSAMALRKYVYFLETSPIDTKMEFFGHGEIYNVPKYVFQ